MTRTLDREIISTKQQKIADLARRAPQMVLLTLAHHIDLAWMEEAYRRTRKDGAVGVDGVTAAAYEERLQENLSDLLERFKSGRYRAPPVRRVHIPKAVPFARVVFSLRPPRQSMSRPRRPHTEPTPKILARLACLACLA